MNISDSRIKWPQIAKSLTNRIAFHQLHPSCLEQANLHCSEGWAIACSGGPDSLALLLLIWHFFPHNQKQMHVLHYNHQLRKEADLEEAFVRDCAQALGLGFHSKKMPRLKKKDEATLRLHRQNFYNETLKQINAKILFLGHQKNDVAEALLMRLSRGSGLGGIISPRPVQKFAQNNFIYLRPLINLTKETLLNALHESGAPWHEDSSNKKDSYFRNRIRNKLIKEWEAVSPTHFWKGIERSRNLLEEDDIALNAWAKTLAQGMDFSRKSIDLNCLEGHPKALYRRVLYRWLLAHRLETQLTAFAKDQLVEALMLNKKLKLSINPSESVLLEEKRICIEKNEKPSLLRYLLEKECVELSQAIKNKILSGQVDNQTQAFLVEGSYSQRQWLPGDTYRPIGLKGSKKLHNAFIDAKIPSAERKHLPVITCSKTGEIAWVPGLPISETFKVKAVAKKACCYSFQKL